MLSPAQNLALTEVTKGTVFSPILILHEVCTPLIYNQPWSNIQTWIILVILEHQAVTLNSLPVNLKNPILDLDVRCVLLNISFHTTAAGHVQFYSKSGQPLWGFMWPCIPKGFCFKFVDHQQILSDQSHTKSGYFWDILPPYCSFSRSPSPSDWILKKSQARP